MSTCQKSVGPNQPTICKSDRLVDSSLPIDSWSVLLFSAYTTMVFGRRKPSSSTDTPLSSDAFLPVEGADAVCENQNNDNVEQAPSSSFRLSSQQQSSSLQQQPSPHLYKFGIMDRLNEAVASKAVNASNRSPDLIPLMKSFDIFRKKLRHTITVAKKYHQSMMTLDLDRIQV
jgi:hypothetical protein